MRRSARSVISTPPASRGRPRAGRSPSPPIRSGQATATTGAASQTAIFLRRTLRPELRQSMAAFCARIERREAALGHQRGRPRALSLVSRPVARPRPASACPFHSEAESCNSASCSIVSPTSSSTLLDAAVEQGLQGVEIDRRRPTAPAYLRPAPTGRQAGMPWFQARQAPSGDPFPIVWPRDQRWPEPRQTGAN